MSGTDVSLLCPFFVPLGSSSPPKCTKQGKQFKRPHTSPHVHMPRYLKGSRLCGLILLHGKSHLLHRINPTTQPTNPNFMLMVRLLFQRQIQVGMVPVFDVGTPPRSELDAFVVDALGGEDLVDVEAVRVHVEVMHGVFRGCADSVGHMHTFLVVGELQLMQRLLYRQTSHHATNLRELSVGNINIFHFAFRFRAQGSGNPSLLFFDGHCRSRIFNRCERTCRR